MRFLHKHRVRSRHHGPGKLPDSEFGYDVAMAFELVASLHVTQEKAF